MIPLAQFILATFLATSVLGNQIVLSNWETFRQNTNTHSHFQGANSPDEIGITDLPGDGIWYLKSYHSTDSEQSFQITIPIERLLCKPTNLLLAIRYFNHLAPVTVWPTLADSDYVRLNESSSGWTTVVLSIDVERAPHVLIDGVVLPTGHILFDEIILLFTKGDCDAGTVPTFGTTTRPIYSTSSFVTSTTVSTYQTEDQSQTDPIWQTSGTTAEDSTPWPTHQTTTYSPPVTYLPDQCPYPPGESPGTVNGGFKGFVEWQLSCMTSWIEANGKESQLDSIPLPDYQIHAEGNTFDFNIEVSNLQILGTVNAIAKSQKKIEVTNYDVNGGFFYAICEYCFSYYTVDFPFISFAGQYALNGTVLSVFPYNAAGEFRIEVNFIPSLSVSFQLENGTIFIRDAYFESYLYSPTITVTGLPQNELSEELYKELIDNVKNFLYSKTQQLFDNAIWQRDLELNRVYEQYIRYMFEGVSILEIIKTPIVQRFPITPTTENWLTST